MAETATTSVDASPPSAPVCSREEREKEVIKEYNLKTSEYKGVKVSPRKSVFDLRTSAMRTEGEKKKGRLYCPMRAQKCGGIRVEEMILGLKYAHLSCTDDSEERLQNASPNSLVALERVVGGDDPCTTARLPLSAILKERFNLNLDCWIDESGYRKGRPVDTQGYIASNEDTIVLSYRFTTSILDWITNLSMTSSEWEPDKDEALGHAGFCSCGKGWWTKLFRPLRAKPRVHTAYYNNFIYTIPMIRKHIIEPLLDPKNRNAKPKKIYVVGCSLGAAMSQIAYCWILQELYDHLKDPEFKAVERLISVTGGSPRVGGRKFRDVMMGKLKSLREAGLDRAVVCRCVYNNDIVPHAPPNVLAFHHLDKAVYITKGGEHVLINPDLSKRFTKIEELKTIYKTIFQKKKEVFDEKVDEAKEKVHDLTEDVQERLHRGSNAEHADAIDSQPPKETTQTTSTTTPSPNPKPEKTPFQIECENSPEVIRDHMVFWYLSYLEKLQQEQKEVFALEDDDNDHDNNDDNDDARAGLRRKCTCEVITEISC